MDWIRPLAEITLADIDDVGGKAAHLGAMLRAGFPVPPGFVIDTTAFISHFGEVTDPLVRPAVPRLQAELMANVVDALITHLGDSSELAVRSSATSEDGEHASFAGQHSTYYFVTPNRLDQAIVDCWMSLWSNAALAYRRAGWTEMSSGEPVRMAVIVQKMINADRSGVAFSRHPINPECNECVIEASWGLGAALVDGRVTPDHIRVGEHNGLSHYEVSDKRLQVSVAPSNYSGNRLQEVARAKRDAKVLSDAEAETLANTAWQLETLFEKPQDVEWAYTGEQLHLLQSRPITSRPAHIDVDERLVLFKPLAENFTEPLTPLSEDLYAAALPPVGAFYEGRLYLDFDLLKELVPYHINEQELTDLALLRSVPERLRLSIPGVLKLAALGSLGFLIDGANWMRTSRASDAALARYKRIVEKIQHDPRYDPLMTIRRLVWGQHPFEPIGHHMMYANISAGRYFLYIGVLRGLVKRFAPDYPLTNLSKVYHGREDLQSMELLKRLGHLGELLQTALAEDDEASRTISAVLENGGSSLPQNHPFTVEYDAFLHEFGHRGPREMELAAPSWREAPGKLLKLLCGHAEHASANTTHGAHLAALDELHGHLKPWQQRVVDALIGRISRYIALRENSRHYHIMAFDAVRQKVLKLEQTLLAQGKLKVEGDIFFLRWDELSALTHDAIEPSDAHVSIRRRRRDWRRAARRPTRMTVNLELSDVEGREGLTGQCASPGEVEGTARLIHNLSEGHRLGEGEVLVAPYTDPAWTPLFTRASAVVVGTGSFLSHAGTVARELHLPCVVDVVDCMLDIEDGQRIRVDASNGCVEVAS